MKHTYKEEKYNYEFYFGSNYVSISCNWVVHSYLIWSNACNFSIKNKKIDWKPNDCSYMHITKNVKDYIERFSKLMAFH